MSVLNTHAGELAGRFGAVEDPAPAAPTTSTTAEPESNSLLTLGFNLYLLFIVSWFLQSGRRYSILGSIRFDLLLVLAISVLCVLSPKRKMFSTTSLSTRTYVFILIVYAVVTIPFVEWPGSVLKAGIQDFIKAAMFCIFTATLVRTERDLGKFLFVFVGCQAFRVLEPLYLHITQGYWGSFATMGNWEAFDRLAGAPADIVNPNGLAFVIVTTLAFAHFLSPVAKVFQLAYLGFLPLALYALALTGSRTGFVALVIVVGVIWWKSQRKVMMAAIIIATVVVAVPLMSDTLTDRYLSLFESNTKNSATTQLRKDDVMAGLAVAMRRPFFGYGLGTSGEANANFGTNERPVHLLYLEVVQELGFIGLPIFLAFMTTLTMELSRTRAKCRQVGATGLVPRAGEALHTFLCMNLVFSLASYGLNSYEWYLMAGLATVLAQLAHELPQNGATTMAPSLTAVQPVTAHLPPRRPALVQPRPVFRHIGTRK
jgi:O-antigen ligase